MLLYIKKWDWEAQHLQMKGRGANQQEKESPKLLFVWAGWGGGNLENAALEPIAPAV